MLFYMTCLFLDHGNGVWKSCLRNQDTRVERECCNLEAAKRKTTRKLVRIGFEWRSLHTILKSPITIASMIPLSKFHDQNRFLSKKRLGWNYHFSLIKLQTKIFDKRKFIFQATVQTPFYFSGLKIPGCAKHGILIKIEVRPGKTRHRTLMLSFVTICWHP